MLTWLLNVLRGACMGIADAVPGVSGGTIALILGIYKQFVGAISGIGGALVKALFSRELWRRVWRGLRRPGETGTDAPGRHAEHLLFLSTLGVGVVAALVVGARFIPDLLNTHPSQMYGFFLGLVVASIAIPLRMLGTRGPRQWLAMALAAVATFFIVDLPLDQSQNARGTVTVTLPGAAAEPVELTALEERTTFITQRYGGQADKREVTFLPERPVTIAPGELSATVPVVARLAGDIANLEPNALVVATGLPEGTTVVQEAPTSGGTNPALWFIFLAGVIAISAMVLPGISGSFILLMLGLYHYIFYNLRALIYDRDTAALVVVGVFIAAVIVGILSFARLVHWLLGRFHDVTIAALIGIMIGSIRKLWPFTTVDAAGASHPTLPDALDGTVGATLATIAAGVAIVLVLDRLARIKSEPTPA